MSILFDTDETHLSLVEQLGNATLQYRQSRDISVNRTISIAINDATRQLISYAAGNFTNAYTFVFGSVEGWAGLSTSERNLVAAGVSEALIKQDITVVRHIENKSPGEYIQAASLICTWVVPDRPFVAPAHSISEEPVNSVLL